MITPDFKYKTFIKGFIFDKYGISKKDIITIKLYETFNKLHNYIIILKDPRLLENSNDNRFSWRKLINLYNIPFAHKSFTQSEIYNFIKEYDDSKLWCKYEFIVNKDLPQYIDYKFKYNKLIDILSLVKFKY